VDRREIQRLETFFRRRFNLPSIVVRQRPQKDDSAEVYIGDEFVGVVFRDEEEGDLTKNFSLAILDIALDYGGKPAPSDRMPESSDCHSPSRSRWKR
jgi:hypothetical protein